MRRRILILSPLAAITARADNPIPRYDHVVIVMEENHAYTQVIGAASAPYINALAAGGAPADTHPDRRTRRQMGPGRTEDPGGRTAGGVEIGLHGRSRPCRLGPLRR